MYIFLKLTGVTKLNLTKLSIAFISILSMQNIAVAETTPQFDNNVLFLPSVGTPGITDRYQDVSFKLTDEGTWELQSYFDNKDPSIEMPVMAETYSMRAFYGDPSTNSVVTIDIPAMEQVGSTATAATPYPVDRAGPLNKIYAVTRGVDSIDIIHPNTLDNLGSIDLQHKPRSGAAYNAELAVQLVAGADKPMSSLIDPFTDTVVATAGSDEITTANGDFGGGLASGHPFWFSKHKFAVIDRANRSIKLYKLSGDRTIGFSTELIDETNTPTSVHHFVSRKRSSLLGNDKYIYYALAEGAPADNISPKILEIRVKDDSIEILRTVNLSGFDASTMGSHHADLHPGGVYIYVGSTEGHMFIINRKNMQIVATVETGLGSAHTRFVASKGLAIVTNHKDTFVTIINSNNHTKIIDVNVSPAQENGQILQSHTSFVDPADKNYYAFASDSGTFYELNLESFEVTRTVHTGGTPRQGVFIALGDDD